MIRLRQLYPDAHGAVTAEEAYPLPDGRHVRANMISSLDGAAYLQGRTGGLSGPADQRLFAALRGLCDVILVGAGTMAAEKYGPARPSPARREWRRAAGLAEVPPIAVVSARLQIDFSGPFFAEAQPRPIVVTTASAPAGSLARARNLADVIVAGSRDLDAPAAIAALAERGLQHVLCEGGPVLLANLLAARVVDELCLTIAPTVIGGDPRRIVDGLLPQPLAGRLCAVFEADGFLFTRYELNPR